MVVTNEERKYWPRRGGWDSDHDNIFCGLECLPKDKRNENTAKGGKKNTLLRLL